MNILCRYWRSRVFWQACDISEVLLLNLLLLLPCRVERRCVAYVERQYCCCSVTKVKEMLLKFCHLWNYNTAIRWPRSWNVCVCDTEWTASGTELRAISCVLLYDLGLHVVKLSRSCCWAVWSRNLSVRPAVGYRLQVFFFVGRGRKGEVQGSSDRRPL